MERRSHRRSPLALAILALLYEAPMHPYRMQQLIKERGKDEVINVRDRSSIYQTIERLLRAGLIAVAETARDERRPERTVYRLTEEGGETARDWLREMLATPAREFPEFPAALSLIPLLAPEDAMQQLALRAIRIEAGRARTQAMLAATMRFLPRLFLLESEYEETVRRAELAWVRALIDDLRAGRLPWSEKQMRAMLESSDLAGQLAEAAKQGPPPSEVDETKESEP